MNALENQVKNILLTDWDPIGVKDVPKAQDEYDAYIADICKMLYSGRSISELYNHLRWIEVERIGLDGDDQHTKQIAAKLAEL